METGWQREFAVFKCEAAANSVTGHVCVNSNKRCQNTCNYPVFLLISFISDGIIYNRNNFFYDRKGMIMMGLDLNQ